VVTLEASELFKPLSTEDLNSLGAIAHELEFGSGQEIFREGDTGDGVYMVKEGQVEMSTLIAPTSRHIFAQAEPGDIFGEMAVVDAQPRSIGAVASKQTTVYFFPRDEILQLVERCPALARTLLREISRRLREFNRMYVREVLRTERLAIVGRFASAIVHDLKNPLNVIGLSAEMAAKPAATPEMRQTDKANIHKQVERISGMLGEILDFTKGHSDFQLGRTDYARFVQQVLEDIRAEVALKSVKVDLENAPPAVALQLNPERLCRVFYNLICNATDAMPDGGRVVVRFQSNPEEIVTEIEDSGPGIAPEIAWRLFEEFATHGKAHGTGLGLAICKRIIEDHQGWIRARNQPGGGAVFAFGLPRPNP
jgi:signal transduction histidine kinase